MAYCLVRESDGAGDSGPMSTVFYLNETKDGALYEHNCEPRIGAGIKVGSVHGRTYAAQDWWATTPVTEILERSEEPDGSVKVRFRTRNSVYTWRKF